MKTPKLKDLKSIHQWVSEASAAETFFISLLIYPLFLLLYKWVPEEIGLKEYKIYVIGFITILYCAAILIMKNSQSNDSKMKDDLNVIIGYSDSIDKEMISFSTLKDKFSFEIKYIHEIIKKYPDRLMLSTKMDGTLLVKNLELTSVKMGNMVSTIEHYSKLNQKPIVSFEELRKTFSLSDVYLHKMLRNNPKSLIYVMNDKKPSIQNTSYFDC